MPNKQNLDIVDAFSSKFEKASGVYFTDYLGLSVKDITELRSKFTSDGVEFCVVKNKLAQISFKNAGFEEIGDVSVVDEPVGCFTDPLGYLVYNSSGVNDNITSFPNQDHYVCLRNP